MPWWYCRALLMGTADGHLQACRRSQPALPRWPAGRNSQPSATCGASTSSPPDCGSTGAPLPDFFKLEWGKAQALETPSSTPTFIGVLGFLVKSPQSVGILLFRKYWQKLESQWAMHTRRRIPMRFPANVLSGIDDTMGSTFFDLNALQVRLTPPATSSP